MLPACFMLALANPDAYPAVPFADITFRWWLLLPWGLAGAAVLASTGFLEAGDVMRRSCLESPPLAGVVFFLCATSACWAAHLVLPRLFGSWLGRSGTALAGD